MINYDRRGRGGSGDTAPYSVDREVEDLRAIAEVAGSEISSSAPRAARSWRFARSPPGYPAPASPPGIRPTSLREAAPRSPINYAEQQANLAKQGNPGAMVELFLTGAVGMSPEFVAGLQQGPFWGFLETAAIPALVYDAELAGNFSLNTDQLAQVSCPVLVLDGGTTPWLSQAAEAVATATPSAARQTLTGQQHNVEATALAGFFSS